MGFSQDEFRTPAARSVTSEGNSQDLRFLITCAMSLASHLYSLLRIGGWNSFASVNERKPCVALGLLLNRCFRVRKQGVPAEASFVEVIRKKATSTGWDSVPKDLRERIVGSRNVRWFWKRQQSVPSEAVVSVGVKSKKQTTTTWDSRQMNVLLKVDFRDLSRFRTISNSRKKFIENEASKKSRGGISEGVYTAINSFIKNKFWRCSGYDLHSKSWKSLPPLSYLPPPDAELFKEYSMSGHGGRMCAEISKLPNKRQLVVFNPMTGETRALPPLLHPRNPVLVHTLVDSAMKSYKVIEAGSSAASDEHLSGKVEVFDSSTSKRKEACDLPDPAFGLNEHQAGVCLNSKLFFISFLEGRGVVDVENGTWLLDLATPIPWSSSSNTLHLDESDGKLFLCSEQASDQSADDCIDELEYQNPQAGVLTCRWRSFVKVKESGGRGLEVHPEHTRVGFRAEKPDIYNPLSRKKINILLASCLATMMPNGACAGDQTEVGPVDSLSSMWISESPDYAKKAVVALLVGLAMIGGRVAWGIFRRRQAPGHRFDIMPGLERSDIPRRRDPLREILPVIPA